MKISIIIPTYNRKDFLNKCLNSLFAQDYAKNRYEIIIVDSGNDKTRDLIKNLQKENKNLRYFKQKQKGAAAARNKGIKKSRYGILAFTDDDCIVSKNWLKNISLFYKKHPKASACGNFYNMVFYGNEDPNKKKFISLTKYFEKLHRKQKIKLLNGFGVDFFPGTGNFSIRKKAIYSIGFFDESIKGCEDLDLTYKLLNLGFLLYLNPHMTTYHYTPANLKKIFVIYYKYGRDHVYFIKKYHKKELIIQIPFFNKKITSKFIFPFCLRLDILKLMILSLFFGIEYFLLLFILYFIISLYKIKEIKSAIFNVLYNLFIETGYLAGHFGGSLKNKVIYI